MHACYWSLLVSGIDCFELLYYYIYYNAILSTILILKFGEHQPKFNSLFYLFITYLSTITALPSGNGQQPYWEQATEYCTLLNWY